MKITFLGGANEIGASATLVEMDGHCFLVDCGIRMRSSEVLPNLEALEGRPLEAIFLTHAHLDHTGATPILHQHFPQVPVYTTPPSKALIQLLLYDAIHIMKLKQDQEGEIPIYTPQMAQHLVEHMQPVHFNYSFKPFQDDLCVYFHPAGHILGAACIVVQGNEGSLMLTGDIHITDQLTVPGMLPVKSKSRVVVMESTYGGRLHADRQVQEEQLVKTVGEVIAQGGKVLIPAFALGRAQEVILILLRAFTKKQLSPFPVYVDGMVRAVCKIYRNFPRYVTPYLRQKIERWGDPFFGFMEHVQAVTAPEQRSRILEGPPCCIISSSGMLSGGPSQFYAQQLAGGENNLIAITGYQDEEAPGRALLELCEKRNSDEPARLNLQGTSVTVRCQVAKYTLSAHIDSSQILTLLQTISPREVLLVHGDQQARQDLRDCIREHKRLGHVYLPDNGDSLAFHARHFYRSAGSRDFPGIGNGPFDEEGVMFLYENLSQTRMRKHIFTLQELYQIWYGSEGLSNKHPTALEEELLRFEEILESSLYFVPDLKRPYLYRLAKPEDLRPVASKDKNEQEELLQQIDKLFPPETGLYRKSIFPQERKIVLNFNFPLVIRDTAVLEELSATTGWSITINPSTNINMLISYITSHLPAGYTLLRNPAVYTDRHEVVITLAQLPPPEEQERLRQQTLADTGFNLIWKKKAVDYRLLGDPQWQGKKMEINTAFGYIANLFAKQPHAPYRKSKKGNQQEEWIELSFISSNVAQRYKHLLERIPVETGWQYRINPNADQHQVLQIARQMVGEVCTLYKNPSFLREQNTVRVRVHKLPSAQVLEQLQSAFYEATGLRLVVELK